jgi:tetratricopeptide (TPR) repeat protein
MERAQHEVQAERAVRRGDLSAALAMYRKLVQAFPQDPRLQERLADVEGSMHPAELIRAKSVAVAADPDLRPSTPEQEGERLCVMGDYAGAAAAYRRALGERPDNELVRERLDELYRLARADQTLSPTDESLPPARQALLQALLGRIASRRRARARWP